MPRTVNGTGQLIRGQHHVDGVERAKFDFHTVGDGIWHRLFTFAGGASAAAATSVGAATWALRHPSEDPCVARSGAISTVSRALAARSLAAARSRFAAACMLENFLDILVARQYLAVAYSKCRSRHRA